MSLVGCREIEIERISGAVGSPDETTLAMVVTSPISDTGSRLKSKHSVWVGPSFDSYLSNPSQGIVWESVDWAPVYLLWASPTELEVIVRPTEAAATRPLPHISGDDILLRVIAFQDWSRSAKCDSNAGTTDAVPSALGSRVIR